MAGQACNVGHAVVGAGACAKRRATNVDGIGPVVDGFYANVGIACRGQEFKLKVGEGHGAIIPVVFGALQVIGSPSESFRIWKWL